VPAASRRRTTKKSYRRPRSLKSFIAWESPLQMDAPREELGGASLNDLGRLRFEELGRFKQARAFPHGYDRDYLSFYAPRDSGVHMVLLWTLLQARSSVAINMYGFDDPHMVALLRHHAQDRGMVLTLSLDSSQAGGRLESELLEELRNDLKGNSIAIGRSEKGAISHHKLMVVDGLYLVSGSTNWSYGGELEQDNQLTLSRDAVACAEARDVMARNHDVMLKQMAKKVAEARKKPKPKPKKP
jgi:phospholipase D-like protein